MSKRQFRSQASSGRGGIAVGGFGSSGFAGSQASVLSYIQEPLDFSSIDDPNLVVTLKNLSKKDETTKAKALEDVQAYVTSSNLDLSDAFLDIWTKIFPRLTIDNSRRVRQLTHVQNGTICSKSGKRIAKYMPRICGPWLAGSFDTDRLVSRAAQDALSLVFPTKERIEGVRKAFHQSILEYCNNAALHETIKTLSDERVSSSDDAEATFARVVASSLAVIGSLLSGLDAELVDQETAIYEQIFSDPNLWTFVYHTEVSIRRAVHKLVQTCLTNKPDFISDNLVAVSAAYIYKGLNSDQTGSSLDFVETLGSLTLDLPHIWTDAYTAKRPAISRLRHFLKQGSQSGPTGYWVGLNRLIRALPNQILPATQEEVGDILSAARAGVCRREDRFSATAAWPAYFGLANVITSGLERAMVESMLIVHVFPMVSQYIFPSSETAEWAINGSKAASTISETRTIGRMTDVLAQEWPKVTQRLIEMAKMSQPEQSKDFQQSQNNVIATGERWSTLQNEFWRDRCDQALSDCFVKASAEVLAACTSLLISRRGKPYGAAGILAKLLLNCGQRVLRDEAFHAAYFAFAKSDLMTLIFSPSWTQLVSGLYAVNQDPQFPEIFENILTAIVDADEPQATILDALRASFITGTPESAVAIAMQSHKLQGFLCRIATTSTPSSSINTTARMMHLGAADPSTVDTVLSSLVSSLMSVEDSESALLAFDRLAGTDPSIVQTFASRPGGAGELLLPSLLRLEQSPDHDISEKATSLSTKLSTSLIDTGSNRQQAIVLRHLEDVSSDALPIDAVEELAARLLGPKPTLTDVVNAIPSVDAWLTALRSAMKPPRISLSLTSPLGGAVYFMQEDAVKSEPSRFDAEGLSQAFRIALYVTKLVAEAEFLHESNHVQGIIFLLLHVSVALAEDNISVLGSNGFWRSQNGLDNEPAALEFVSEARRLLADYWMSMEPETASDDDSEYARFLKAIATLRDSQVPSLSLSYYVSLVYVETLTNLFELHGFSSSQAKDSDAILKDSRTNKPLSGLVECLVAHQQPLAGSQSVTRICNELVTDLTGLIVVQHTHEALERLVVLNTIFRTQPNAVDGIAKQRLIFLVKHIIPWLASSQPPLVRIETYKALAELLPGMRDMYGEHWEQATSALLSDWKAASAGQSSTSTPDTDIVLINASLRLLATMRRLSTAEEPNEDLVDTLREKDTEIRSGLIDLLISSSTADDTTNQPLMITHGLLARQLASLPFKLLKDVDDLYPLLYSSSRPIVQAAFDLLHQQVPSAQEQISFDAAIDNKAAHLPDELISLILEAPTLDSLMDADFSSVMPLSLQGYLFSWRLLFDHFHGSSYRVKNDYIEQLKDGSYLDGLLDLAFDFLGLRHGKAVDISSFDVQNYVSDTEPQPEKDVQWLLAHLYFSALTHLPSLVKSYYFNIRSRQVSGAIESWTAKHLSPLIIETSLRGVAAWSETSVKEDPEFEKMTVKVCMRSKEVHVSYIVDEQTMAIKVVLPDAYPLASAEVLGVSRVAVKEDKWQSWLRNCRGVITFSNGSITDGLTAWRKNVTGAMKGQSECAICYSIISADKQLPTKRCPTCKNLFHASCLLKWFKTSNASTCPLCRNPFNFN